MATDYIGRTCPFDQSVIKPGDAVVKCSRCGTYHHEECWNEHGQCTTPGCSGSPIAMSGLGGRSPPDIVIDESDFESSQEPLRQPTYVPTPQPVYAQQKPTNYGMGPRGKERNPFFAVILFPIITLGIYSLFWYFNLWNEARNYAHGRNGVRIHTGVGAFFLYGILPIIMMIAGGAGLVAASGDEEAVFVGLIPGLIWSLVGTVKLAGLPRKMRIAKGIHPSQAGHPGAAVLWILIPYLGGLIMWLVIQSSMNKFWREET